MATKAWEVTVIESCQRTYRKVFQAATAAEAEALAQEDLDWPEDLEMDGWESDEDHDHERTDDPEIYSVEPVEPEAPAAARVWPPTAPRRERREEQVPNPECRCARCERLRAQRLLPATTCTNSPDCAERGCADCERSYGQPARTCAECGATDVDADCACGATEVCRTCGKLYRAGGDGFDGECPGCADQAFEREVTD